MKNNRVLKLTIAGVLIAIGIIIPLYSPIKFPLEPWSFTLASHVVIFFAMFISPLMAIAVALGTAAGFALSPLFTLVVVFRALSHVVFAGLGAYFLQKTTITKSAIKLRFFSLTVAVIHSVCEIIVSSAFYFGGLITLTDSFLVSVIIVVGVGTFMHSLIDFEIAMLIRIPLLKQPAIREIMK